MDSYMRSWPPWPLWCSCSAAALLSASWSVAAALSRGARSGHRTADVASVCSQKRRRPRWHSKGQTESHRAPSPRGFYGPARATLMALPQLVQWTLPPWSRAGGHWQLQRSRVAEVLQVRECRREISAPRPRAFGCRPLTSAQCFRRCEGAMWRTTMCMSSPRARSRLERSSKARGVRRSRSSGPRSLWLRPPLRHHRNCLGRNGRGSWQNRRDHLFRSRQGAHQRRLKSR